MSMLVQASAITTGSGLLERLTGSCIILLCLCIDRLYLFLCKCPGLSSFLLWASLLVKVHDIGSGILIALQLCL